MQLKESKINWHFYISLVKSIIRMGAGTALVFQQFILSGILLILAEILGVIEEL
jgi:hypothetical protein